MVNAEREKARKEGVMGPRRIALMVAFIVNAGSFDELAAPPNFGFHSLGGDRDGDYAMTITRNWRMTFTKVGRSNDCRP